MAYVINRHELKEINNIHQWVEEKRACWFIKSDLLLSQKGELIKVKLHTTGVKRDYSFLSDCSRQN
ncbi:hypothetical protein PROSTU_03528 [Providencia stuartii ATCC 25827]|uniref:Uncharacterized protein n=1 Tax=Providencia stuartii ATCC 25827 TaxID=471874 RepID=A0AA86YLT6_PROST|nr:hypothetical protein PROSTU_03528 [Providencia stuartii ATCC 25827]